MPSTAPTDHEAGCAYLLDRPANGGLGPCGLPQRRGSSYCRRHHALCHLRRGSAAETKRLRELEQLAQAVGGRFSPRAGGPSRHFLERLGGLAQPYFHGGASSLGYEEEAL